MHEVTCDAFAVVRLPDGRWDPVRLRLDKGIVVDRERLALDAMDYPGLAYQHIASSAAEHAATEVDRIMADRKCEHPEPQGTANVKARYIKRCELCGGLKDDHGKWWWGSHG